MSRIVEFWCIGEGSVVLDFGCGTGRYTLGISGLRAPMICGLDPSMDMLKRAMGKDRSSGVMWVQADGNRLPFRDGSFHCVYMTLVIHHVEDREAALREIRRTLRQGGGRCVVLTNSHSRLKGHVLRHFPGIIRIDLDRFPTIPELRRVMLRAGFSETRFHPVRHLEYMPTEEYLERVRGKYVSTLTLIGEEEFRRGYEIFEGRVRRIYGDRVLRHSGFDFVVGIR